MQNHGIQYGSGVADVLVGVILGTHTATKVNTIKEVRAYVTYLRESEHIGEKLDELEILLDGGTCKDVLLSRD